MRKPLVTILTLLAVIVIARALLLEIPNLVEPTEGRYAAMAHRMVESDSWIFPQFPRGNSYEPYKSKPPLFFWLMAVSYKVLGVDEWCGRLPSFLCYVVVALALICTGIVLKKERIFSSAALIWATSLIPFFFSGAIVVDVCLTAGTTIALLAALIMQTDNRWQFPIIFWFGTALGVLTKGPVALILIFGTLIVHAFLRKDVQLVKKTLSPLGIILFLGIVAPWFFIAERESPGFSYYFFVHENFLRYFVKDYGDLYGSGHVYPYGTALGFFLLAFFPWTLLLLLKLRKGWKTAIESDQLFISVACGFTVIFFCGMRQLHIGYVIPALPFAALLLAQWYERSKEIIIYSATSACFCVATIIVATPYIDKTYSSLPLIACLAKHRVPSQDPVAMIGAKSYGARLLDTGWAEELVRYVPLSFYATAAEIPDLPNDIIIHKSAKATLKTDGYTLMSALGPWEWWSNHGDLTPITCTVDDEL